MTPEALPPISINIQSRPFEVREALAKIQSALRPLALDGEESGTVEIVLAEVLNNIVEHAYEKSETGQISILCQLEQDGLHIQVKDRGAAIPEGGLLKKEAIDIPPGTDQLPEGGFGWFLIQNLADDIRYTRDKGENRLDLRLAIGLSA